MPSRSHSHSSLLTFSIHDAYVWHKLSTAGTACQVTLDKQEKVGVELALSDYLPAACPSFSPPLGFPTLACDCKEKQIGLRHPPVPRRAVLAELPGGQPNCPVSLSRFSATLPGSWLFASLGLSRNFSQASKRLRRLLPCTTSLLLPCLSSAGVQNAFFSATRARQGVCREAAQARACVGGRRCAQVGGRDAGARMWLSSASSGQAGAAADRIRGARKSSNSRDKPAASKTSQVEGNRHHGKQRDGLDPITDRSGRQEHGVCTAG